MVLDPDMKKRPLGSGAGVKGGATMIAPQQAPSGLASAGLPRAVPAASGEGSELGQFGPLEGSGAQSLAPPSEPPSSQGLVELPAGFQIRKYEIIKELGRGGMGVVYLARDNQLGRRVAIKFLQTHDPEMTRRFIIEAQATARCTHENIVVIHEVGEHEGSPFMVLEYVEGQPLASLRSSTPMPITRTVEIMVAVVRALARAHQEGIVHRDLKPENILLSNTGAVKVLDFGIAKLLRDEPNGPEVREELPPSRKMYQGQKGSMLAGTALYMSPEQWGVGTIDHRTDIWAVGMILYELLAGGHPLINAGDHLWGWVTDLTKAMPSVRQANPEIPAQLAGIVDICLRKNQSDRYPDVSALLRELEPFLPGRFHTGPVQIETGPYAGLRAFQEEDAGRFFGRANELGAMLTRIRETPMMACVGPSGVGKSSFLRAGLVPALKGSGQDWEVLVLRPGRYPMMALANMCAPLIQGTDLVGDVLRSESGLRSHLFSEPGYLGCVLRNHCRAQGTRLLLFVDQFEELYTQGTHHLERKAFTNCLTGSADDPTSPLRVVLSIRSDFLGRVAEDAQFINELSKGMFFLGPPSADGLKKALVEPAESAGYRFENEAMVRDMVTFLEATPNGLPLLQFAALQLWESRDPQRRILTEASYRGLGGVAGALVSHADKAYARLPPALQQHCRALFVHLVTRERTRAVRTLSELTEIIGADVQALIDELVDSRLLVVQSSEEGATVELVHESLTINWPRLQRWLDESHEDSIFLDQLIAAARQWDTNRRDRGLLWAGEMVDELQRFLRRFKGQLPETARVFAEAVSKQARRSARIKRVALAAGVIVPGVLAAAAMVGVVVISDAKAEAEQSAAVARKAEAEAKLRLSERIEAEKERKVAQKESGRLAVAVERSDAQLAIKNEELEAALVVAKEQGDRARKAQERAEDNERVALEAQERAQAAADELEKLLKKNQRLLDKERERTRLLERERGAPIAELK